MPTGTGGSRAASDTSRSTEEVEDPFFHPIPVNHHLQYNHSQAVLLVIPPKLGILFYIAYNLNSCEAADFSIHN